MNDVDRNYPNHAKVVIVGGGAVGLSIAYHLGKLGIEDVVLLEKNKLTSGTSWHAAGIVGPLRASMNLTKLATYATELFSVLELETGQATGYAQTGGFWLAQTPARLTELRRIAAMGEMNDIDTEILTPAQIKNRYPLINTQGLCGGLWVEQDGQVNPVDLCMAYARGAKQQGVRIMENAQVTAMKVDNGLLKSITLANGEMINCDLIVNAAGCWARELGKLAGLSLPLASCEHMYVVTEPINELSKPCPILRDLDAEIYIKGDSGKLVIGGFESNAKPWDPAGTNADTPYLMFEEDWDHIEPMIEAAIKRIPALENIGITHFMNGPESFTPDTSQLMGKVPELNNYFVAAGFNSIGIMSSAGVGKVMAQWVKQDCPPMDLWEVDIQRFEPAATTHQFLDARMQESVHNQFAMHWPYKQKKTGRELMRSSLHDQFEVHGAVFGVSGIWERPLWFAHSEQEKTIDFSYGQQSWWPCAKREAQYLQHHVGLIELSPFSKIKVSGKDALSFLQYCCTNDIDVKPGVVVYTTMLNQRGGIESEHTVTRTSKNEFLLVSGAASRVKDITRLQKSALDFQIYGPGLGSGTPDCQVKIADETFDQVVLGLMGPDSRKLLQSLCQQSICASVFSFAQSKLMNLQDIPVRATRISFVGELGYELYVANEHAARLFDMLVKQGENYNLGLVGHYCVDGCRLEKGYLHWGHDMGCDDSPLQTGLDFSLRFDKEFIGKQALLEQKEKGLQRHLMQFSVVSDTPPLLLHDEPIYSNNRIVGSTTSGGIGFRTGLSLCHAYIDAGQKCTRSELLNHQYSIGVAGERFELRALNSAVYDPENIRMRG